jgi:hypothetical protein
MRILKIATIAAVLSFPALAQAQIKQPGAHYKYSVELEPHFVFQWAGGYRYFGDEGIGAGLRASIPFIDNGPIDRINNSMGITFGLDYIHHDFDDDYCFLYGPNFNICNDYDYAANAFWLPVAMQWNFFVHPRINVFGEVGLAIEHVRLSIVQPCPGGPGLCEFDDSDTDIEFVFYPGVRFMVADSVGITLRVGFPHLTAGVSFLL